MTSKGYVCEWCGAEFERRSRKGPTPKYCSAAHRQRSHEATVRRRHEDELRAITNLAITGPNVHALQAFQDQVAATVAPSLEAFQAQMAETLHRITGPNVHALQALANAAKAWRQVDPPNWPENVSPTEMCRLIIATGWSLTYVPRSEVITKLHEAEPADREAVLLGHAGSEAKC